MADQGVWFKLWVSALSDPDLANLSLEDFARWTILGAYIKAHGQAGSLHLKAPARALCGLLRVQDFPALQGVLHRLPNVVEETDNVAVSGETCSTVSFLNWSKYQGDYSTPRVRAMREMKRTRGEERRRDEKRGEETRRDETRKEKKREPQAVIPSPAVAVVHVTRSVWQGYLEAYLARYGIEPVRNAKVNGQLARFVQRIPAAEAAEVAAFYVSHSGAFYVRAGHPVDLLLRDAEKLRTEWATGRRITETGARQGDQRQNMGDIAHRLIAKAEQQQAEARRAQP